MKLKDIIPGQPLLFQRPCDAVPRLVKAKGATDGLAVIWPTASPIGVRVNPDYLSPVEVPEPPKTDDGAPAPLPDDDILNCHPVYEIGNYRFVQTCPVSPEQYDVYGQDGVQAAYIRLRWGTVRCEVPDVRGEEICRETGYDDAGCFPDDVERFKFLERVAYLLDKRSENQKEGL